MSPLKQARFLLRTIKKAVKDLDDEGAHLYEDILREHALTCALKEVRGWRTIAEVALSTKDFKFTRYCS